MKKILLCILFMIMVFTISSCSNQQSYTLKDLSIYDCETDKYIEIGQSLNYVTDILGSPNSEKHAEGLYPSKELIYDNYALTLTFDEDDCLKYIKFTNSEQNIDTERLKIAKKLSVKSTPKDFMKIFPDATNTESVAHCERLKIVFDAESKSELSVIDVNSDSREKHYFSAYIDYNDKEGIRFLVVGEYGPNSNLAKISQ